MDILDKQKTKDKEIIREILQKFADANVSKQDLLEIVNELKTDELPLSLFKTKKLSNLEAIVKYLRENKSWSYKEIGEKLKRNPLTLAVSYKNSKKKMPDALSVDETNTIPYAAFKENLSVLESVASYLKEQGMKQVQIANALGKDPRTISTVIRRAKKKIILENENN